LSAVGYINPRFLPADGRARCVGRSSSLTCLRRPACSAGGVPSREDTLKFRKQFDRAQGWLALGKPDEAGKALDELPHDFHLAPEVLSLRTEIALASGRWEAAAGLARQLTQLQPQQPMHWTQWAFATRRQIDLAAARRILEEAAQLFPDDALIHFNLACYASQQGRFTDAAQLLGRAMLLQPALKEVAMTDPDLTPLWEAMGRKLLD
jgi:Flp pilus assembly protein TadD